MPSQQAIIQKLSDVYGSQVNAWFTNLTVVNETTDWDIGTTTEWGSTANPIPAANTTLPAYNKILDLGGNIDGMTFDSEKPNEVMDLLDGLTSKEEQKLMELRATGSLASHIDVFVIGGCEGIRTSEGYFGHFIPLGDSVPGKTNRNKRVCFVAGGMLVNQAALPKNRVLQIIAHEIGHVIIGKGHPDKEGSPETTGPAPLKGTNPLNRLMHSDLTSKAVAGKLDYNLLVKAEWDTAETWFSNNVDSLTPPP